MIRQSNKHQAILTPWSSKPSFQTTLATLTNKTRTASITTPSIHLHSNSQSCNDEFNLQSLPSLAKRNQSQTRKAGSNQDVQRGFCFLGAPGVGKGTYSKRIASYYKAKVLSSGDLIRECAAANKGTALGNQLQKCINNGQLVPDDIVIPMVVAYLRMLQESFILDGFPRTYYQAKRIHHEYRLHCVAYFKLPDHILINKMLGRRICSNCGSNFNVADIKEGDIDMPSMAPVKDGICDSCGHPLTMRPDDTAETIKERLKIYHKETGPIERFYKDAGLLLEYNIKKGIDDIPDILQKMDKFLEKQ